MVLGKGDTLAVTTAKLFASLNQLKAEFNFSRVPQNTTQSFQVAFQRLGQNRFFDGLFPSLIHKQFLETANHLSSRVSWLPLEPSEQKLFFVESVRQLELPVVTIAQCRLTLFLHGSMSPTLAGSGIELVFDWRDLNQTADAMDIVNGITVAIAKNLQVVSGATCSLETWQAFFAKGQIKNVLSQPLEAGRTFQPEANAPLDPQEDSQAKQSDDLAANPYAARWSGASGRFAGEHEGRENAETHYKKHCVIQCEWPKGQFPSSKEYVAFGSSCLDSAAIYEMRQPANRAVIKYDEESDVLAIGGVNDGHLYTCFRPGGYSYVLRKLESGQWTPPPIDDLVDYQQSLSEKDDELLALMTEWSGCIDEAQAETTACVLELTETKRSSRLLAAIAYQSRLEFLLRRLRRRYLDEADEEKIDGFELHLNELRASLELLFEQMESATPKLISEACRNGLETFSRQVEESFCGQERELLDDVLNSRDNLEFAKMALRSHSWICSFANLEELKSIWGELAKGDVLLKLNLPREKARSSVNAFPETFFWRF